MKKEIEEIISIIEDLKEMEYVLQESKNFVDNNMVSRSRTPQIMEVMHAITVAEKDFNNSCKMFIDSMNRNKKKLSNSYTSGRKVERLKEDTKGLFRDKLVIFDKIYTSLLRLK